MMETILRQWETLAEAQTGIDRAIPDIQVESTLEERALRTLERHYGSDAITSRILSGGRRGFILRGPDGKMRPGSGQSNRRFKSIPGLKECLKNGLISCLLRMTVLMDFPWCWKWTELNITQTGVEQDLMDRMQMIRSGQVRVWTLSWYDLDPKNREYQDPLSDSAIGVEKAGRLANVLENPLFSEFAKQVKMFSDETSLQKFWYLLDGTCRENRFCMAHSGPES